MRRPAPLAEAVGKGRGLSAAGLAFVLLGAVLAAAVRPSASTAEVSFRSGAEALIEVIYEIEEDGMVSEEKASPMTARYSQAGPVMVTKGDMRQFHPLAYCQPNDDHKSGYVAVIKLEHLDRDLLECNRVLQKARKAIARGAEAVIFDVSNNSNAVEQLSVETVRPLIKPVLYIQGEDAKQLLGIVLHRARARVFISPKDTVYGGVDIIVFVSLFAIVLIVCLLFYLKMKLSQRRSHVRRFLPHPSLLFVKDALLPPSFQFEIFLTPHLILFPFLYLHFCPPPPSPQTELTRLTLLAMESMETRKYRAKGRSCTRKLNHDSVGSLSSGSECAICLEHYTDGEEVRVVSCRHKFHRRCVDPWLLRQRSCPRCRYTILDLSRIAIPRPAAPSLVFSPPHRTLASTTVTSPPTIAAPHPFARRLFYPPAPHMFLSHRQAVRPYDQQWNTTGSRRFRGSVARTRLPRRCRGCFCPQCRGDGILGNRRLGTQLSSPRHDTDVSPLSSPASTSSDRSLSSSDTGDASHQGVYGSGSTRHSSPGSDCEAFVFRGHKPTNGRTVAILPQLCSACQNTAPSIEHPLLPAAIAMTTQATPRCLHHHHHHEDVGHRENSHHNDGSRREWSHHYGTMLRDWTNSACNDSHNCGFESKVCWECKRHQGDRVFHSRSQTENSIYGQWEICLDACAESNSCQGGVSLRDVGHLTQGFQEGTRDIEGGARHVGYVDGGMRYGHIERGVRNIGNVGGACYMGNVTRDARHMVEVEGVVEHVEGSAKQVEHVEGSAKQVGHVDGSAKQVGHAEGSAKQVGHIEGSAKHMGHVEGSAGNIEVCAKHVGHVDGGARHVGHVDGGARHVDGGARHVRHVGHIGGARHVHGGARHVRHVGHVDGGARHVGHVYGGAKHVGHVDGGAKHVGHVDGGARNVGHVDGGARHIGHIDSGARHVGHVDGGARNPGNVDGSARNLGRVDGGARHPGNVDGGAMNPGHVDGGVGNDDCGARHVGHDDGGARHVGNDDSGARHTGDTGTLGDDVRHTVELDGVERSAGVLGGVERNARDINGVERSSRNIVGVERGVGDIDGIARHMKYVDWVERSTWYAEGANKTKNVLEEDVWVPLEMPLLLQGEIT
uniref:RING-type E3 ubiquitin transferase n=1 Tax=Eptatretus burgeri TaxID=7764 RepID=A0A8C4QDX9_EPTBU